MALVYFVLSLIILNISKNLLSRQISRLVHLAGGNRQTVVILWSILFLPGTIIHELSHFLFAIITGARTGKIEIFPDYLEENSSDNKSGGVTLGYVQMQKLNPLQGFLIGNAPFVVGLVLMVALAGQIQISFESGYYLYLFFEAYLFLTISNSFFPSWTDIKQTLPLIIIFIITLGVLSFLGFQFFIPTSNLIISIIITLYQVIFISASLNFAIFTILFLITKLIR